MCDLFHFLQRFLADALSTPRLLAHVTRYARLFISGAPVSPTGPMALAWVARQRADGLAEATKQARIALRLADAIEVYVYVDLYLYLYRVNLLSPWRLRGSRDSGRTGWQKRLSKHASL